MKITKHCKFHNTRKAKGISRKVETGILIRPSSTVNETAWKNTCIRQQTCVTSGALSENKTKHAFYIGVENSTSMHLWEYKQT